ncbi:hypothetical protein Cgig2_005499 [Carnegiea gigantea]|uniref:Uncharacterized protein n=1 Tax=Carnegiea gigantea TaxID=171969 RepID=A0A9Q1KCE3_9CARY|nr:hypothetical protein Cgig2_005499 [Carnegiea gigantea]
MKDISAKNGKNTELRKIKSFNGALSTARILENLRSAPPVCSSNGEPSEDGQVSNPSASASACAYGTWGPEAEATYEEFKKLHVDQIKGHGDDNHTVEEVYSRVFNGRSGYLEGLGAGLRHPKKIRIEDELNELSAELQSQLAEQINQLQQESTDREAALN